MKFKIKIDEKSLFFGLKNDYVRGQTATVSTPINQSRNPDHWHKDIMKLYDSGLASTGIPQELIDNCLNKTTSQANSKLLYFFEFSNIYFDGIKLVSGSSFGIYVKEETDPIIINKKGERVKNTHLGRQKLHYPITLHYKSQGFNVDNNEVLNSILDQNGGFAFVVRGFECDVENKSLNFLTSLIGLKGLLLSNVFKKQKGVGKKLLLEEIDLETQDVCSEDRVIVPNDFRSPGQDVDYGEANKVKVENGKIGETFVYENIKNLVSDYAEDVVHTSSKYPTSPYDIEYIENGIKKYIEVKSTSGTKEIFYMSSGEIKFMEKYKDNYTLILVTEVNSRFPKTKRFSREQILALKREFPTVRFYA